MCSKIFFLSEAEEIAEEEGEVVVEETVVENAAVLEKLEKNGAFDEVADNSAEKAEERAGGARETEERAGGARETDETRRKEDGVDDNFTEGDESTIEEIVIDLIIDKIAGEGEAIRDKRAGGARETDKIAGEGEAIRDKIDEVVIEETWVELISEAVREAAEEVKRLSLVDRP